MRTSGGRGRGPAAWWQALRTSLLVVPITYLALAALLVVAMYAVGNLEAPSLSVKEGQLARDLLPAIGSATLTLAGFVLTITTLTIQFTASSYAPRLVEPLRRDRVLQHTLGVALATFAFSFGVLIGVGPDGEVSATAAVAIALAGAAATLLLFIALLDRLTDRLRPGRMMRRVADEGLRVAEHVYDEAGAEDEDASGQDAVPDRVVVEWTDLAQRATVWWEGEYGLLVSVAFDQLRTMACAHGVRIELLLPVGGFLQRREAVAVIHGEGGAPVEDVPGDIAADLPGCLVVDAERTADADPAFAIRLLVDTALRALSPGVNDPTTAAQAIEHVEQLLLVLSGRRLGPRTLRDDGDTARVTVPAPGWDAFVDLGFAEITAACDDPQTASALVRSLDRLGARVPARRRAALTPLAARARQLAAVTA